MALRPWHAVVAIAVIAASASTLTFTPACGFNLPQGICNAKNINGLERASGDPDPTCSACLESVCCDDVGYCADETNGCAESVKQTHECVLEAGIRGALEEQSCKSRFLDAGPHGASMYACMRRSCGSECRLPICQLDPAALQFGSPSCDRCVSGACCPEVNACYGKRTCKLALECIVKNCGGDLGNDFRNASAQDLAAIERRACGSEAQGGPPTTNVISACITKCITEFAVGPNETTDDPSTGSGCLAFRVFSCGARASCARECQSDAGSVDAARD